MVAMVHPPPATSLPEEDLRALLAIAPDWREPTRLRRDRSYSPPMSRRHGRRLRWAGGVSGSIATWQIASHFFAQRSGPDKLVNQAWLERWPKDSRDMVWHFAA